ncbi:Sucrase/ferredoxin-like-domain-containing protein [Spinellus fusiger]|nr:Sucrase/ferredoxin-like-domain-containing protein [Spinellus fusiger]
MDQIPPVDLIAEDPCSTCPLVCDDHKQYPSYLSFDLESSLLGTMKPYSRHVLISTGQSDWPSSIEDDVDTLAAHLSRVSNASPPSSRVIITNTSMLASHSTLPNAHDVILLPDNIIVSNVTFKDAAAFYSLFLDTPLPTDMVVHKNPYESMILICSHKKRDKRCGITAPILQREFDDILREKDICEGEGGTAIFMVSHIGGHKFAGNVICVTHNGTRGIWYGRVNTCHCKAIIEETLLKGKVLKDLYRGAMSHSYDQSNCERIQW